MVQGSTRREAGARRLEGVDLSETVGIGSLLVREDGSLVDRRGEAFVNSLLFLVKIKDDRMAPRAGCTKLE
jgi:hypothetical protein